MIQKHRILTSVGKDKVINVDLQQKFDILEILSLKFTQQDVYSSLCADYGVVCGRITVNDGFGVPNARVSIFIPLSEQDENDPVISALYPYKTTQEKNEEGYRYNLLPARKQHGGHEPTGTFPDQVDILTREEVLEVFEKYYKYTVKTNNAGDFMIWGVPLGEQVIHVDVDLSDIGCFSLRPHDYIKNGFGVDSFKNTYTFKSSIDLDSLPQIVSFDKTIEVEPFWGNTDLCAIGITRTDFDLSDQGVRIEPKATLIGGIYTDTEKNSVNKNCQPRRKMGRKCDLTTKTGKIEAIRFTTQKDLENRPILEFYEIDDDIPEDGGFVFSVPMNMDYVYTNEFGETEITNDTNKGIPTSACYRFRFSMDYDGAERTRTVASYLVPNIREDQANDGQRNASYEFSTNWKAYPTLAVNNNQNRGILYNIDGQYFPRDYFYRMTYNKVYTVSSFHNAYYKGNNFSDDRYIGIKELVPAEEEDCSDTVVTPPVNWGKKNRTFTLLIADVFLFAEHITNLITLTLSNTIAIVFHDFADVFKKPVAFIGKPVRKFAYRLQEAGQRKLYLLSYPECEECNGENEFLNATGDVSGSTYCQVGEGTIQGSVSGTERINFNAATIYPGTSYYSWSPAVHNLGTIHPEVKVYIEDGIGGYQLLIDYDYTDPNTVPSNTFFKTGITTNQMDIVFTFPTQQLGYVEFSSDDSSALPVTITNYTQQTCSTGTSTPIISNSDFVTRQNEYGIAVSGSTTLIELGGPDGSISLDGSGNILLSDNTNSFGENQLYNITIVDLSTAPPAITNNLESGCDLYDTPYDETLITYYYTGLTMSGRTQVNPGSYVPGVDVLATNLRNRNEPLATSYAGQTYIRETPSGETEFSNGIFYFVPASQTNRKLWDILKEYRRRKRVAKLFCGGVVNYSFIDNWLSGSLYFFQFKARRGKYCEDLIREVTTTNSVGQEEKRYYYRSATYYSESNWGDSKTGGRVLGRPTTIVDLGPRDEFIKEICVDASLDPNCSVSRAIGPTSFKSFGELLGLAINYRMDVSNNDFSINDFFNNAGFQFTNRVLDGDIMQLISINNEVGIEEFDLQNAKYLGYSYQVLDPDLFPQVFKPNGYWGPVPITFELDEDGERIRGCLNEPTHIANDGVTEVQGRLTESSQKVPFFLWDKKGTGFGGTNEATSDNQSWDYSLSGLTIQPLQGMTYAYNLTGSTDDSSDKYLLLPMTYTFSGLTFNTSGNTTNIVEFDTISLTDNHTGSDSEYPGFTYLYVTSGTTATPLAGTLYTRYGAAGTWHSQPWDFTKDFIIRRTQDYYSGNKQILSTPFMFYFGLTAGKTGLDKFVTLYGPKGAFPSAE